MPLTTIKRRKTKTEAANVAVIADEEMERRQKSVAFFTIFVIPRLLFYDYSRFTEPEMKRMYRGFKTECPQVTLHVVPEKVLNYLQRTKLSHRHIIWFPSAPPPPPLPSPVSNWSLFLTLPVCRWSSLLAEEGGKGGGGGAKTYGGEKAWSSINRSILWSRWIQWSLAWVYPYGFLLWLASLYRRENASETSCVTVFSDKSARLCLLIKMLQCCALLCHAAVSQAHVPSTMMLRYHVLLYCITFLLCHVLLYHSSAVIALLLCITLLLCHVLLYHLSCWACA